MKKRILLIIAALLTFVVVLAACGKKGDDSTPSNTSTATGTSTNTETPTACTHEWEVESTTATCLEAGVTTSKCKLCQETKTEDAVALGHSTEFVETIKATCQAGGYDSYKCTREGCEFTEKKHETEPSYAPDAHQYEAIGVDATCTTAGYKDQICVLCQSNSGTRENIPALGHTYERADFDGVTGVVKVLPTCEANGQITKTCTHPGCDVEGKGPATVTMTYEDLVAAGSADAEEYKALGHNYLPAEDGSNLVKENKATCTTSGSVEYSCQNGCGTTSTTAEGYEALGHTYERNPDEASWTYDYLRDEDMPTCITAGTQWVVCTEKDCGYSTGNDASPNLLKYGKTIPATGAHVYDANPQVTAPTCTLEGYTRYYCSVDEGCEAYEDRDTTDANGHTWELKEDDLKDGKPFCKTDGNWNYACTVCKEEEYNVKNDTPVENAIHTGYKSGDFTGGIAPTCVTRGSYYCSECETVFKAYDDDHAADATGEHVYGIKGETTASTCSEYGYTTYHCSVDTAACTATERRDYTPYAAHDYSAPSEDGTISCFNCQDEYRDVTTAIQTTTDTLCTCGNKATNPDACTCSLKVEFIATKVPDAAFALTANTPFTKDDFDENCGPALLVLKGAEGTTFTVTVYDDAGEAITTYNIYVDGKDVGDASVVTEATANASGVAYINLTEVAGSIDKVTVTASADATVQMYYPI